MSLPWTNSSEPSNPKTARLHGLGITLLWKEYHLKWQLHKGYKETKQSCQLYMYILYTKYFYGKKYLLGNIASYHFGCYLGTRWVTLNSFHQVHEGRIHKKASDQLVFYQSRQIVLATWESNQWIGCSEPSTINICLAKGKDGQYGDTYY